MRIQRNNNLNEILVSNKPEHMQNGVHHLYVIQSDIGDGIVVDNTLYFQQGPRKDVNSIHGCLEGDLLEIVRHRLQGHQRTEYATRENAIALTHIEEALMWLAKRSDDRAERGVLGTTNK